MVGPTAWGALAGQIGGAPFAEIFKRFHGDFYAIDPMLFSPAEVIVTAIESGESFHAGALHHKLLDASFA